MNLPKIKIEVVSRLEAGEILCTPDRCAEITYVISIGDGRLLQARDDRLSWVGHI
jgi:hypothetical protein